MSKILLVVDMQEGFKGGICTNLKVRVNDYIKKSNYDYYVFTQFKNSKNPLFKSKLGWTNLADASSQKLCLERLPKNSCVMAKDGYGLSRYQLNKIKRLLGNEKQIDICGLQTDACVYAIGLQFFDMHIYPNILINYTATNNDFEVVKNMLIHQFGSVDERI